MKKIRGMARLLPLPRGSNRAAGPGSQGPACAQTRQRRSSRMRRLLRTGMLAMALLAASAWPAVAVPTDVIGEPGCLGIQNGAGGTPPYEELCGAGGNGVQFVSTTPETVVVTFSALYMNGKFLEVVENRNP